MVMGADDEEPGEQNLEVYVTDPVSFSSPFMISYTSFCIQIKTNHSAFSLPKSTVRRKFSEFRWLRSVLQRHHPERDPPQLPSGGLLTWNKFSEEFLERRRNDLEVFINSVILIPVYLSEKALHLFLQTELSTKEIEMNLLGKRDDQIVQSNESSDGRTSPGDNNSNLEYGVSSGKEAIFVTLRSSGDHDTMYQNPSDVEEKYSDGTPWYSSSPSKVIE